MVRIVPRRGKVQLDLSRGEPEVLVQVFGDVRALVASGAPAAGDGGGDAAGDAGAGDPLEALVGPLGEPEGISDDPAVARLFPDAYGDDAAASAEFRGLTATTLRDTKLAALDAVLDDLRGVQPAGTVTLGGERAELWLAALNDVRLVLGSRLEIDEEVWQELERMAPDDPRLPMLELYDWLTVLQERLVHCVAGW